MKFSIHSLFAFAQTSADSEEKSSVSTYTVRQSVQPGDAQLIRVLIAETRSMKTIRERMRYVSGKLLGAVYLRRPLIGSVTETEVFVARMDGFDCITFLETLLSLSRAKSADEFLALLRKIRYRNGVVEYQQRLHYATDWATHLVQLGLLGNMTGGETVVSREKLLDIVPGIKPVFARFCFYPRHELAAVKRWLLDGDLILFASGRKGLDVSHAGMIVRNGEQVLIRHATRHRKKVVEQDLAEFFGILPMSGFIIYRPKEG